MTIRFTGCGRNEKISRRRCGRSPRRWRCELEAKVEEARGEKRKAEDEGESKAIAA